MLVSINNEVEHQIELSVRLFASLGKLNKHFLSRKGNTRDFLSYSNNYVSTALYKNRHHKLSISSRDAQ